MKIEHDDDTFIVDVQTRRDGNSAMKIAWDDSTEVVFGGLYAQVSLLDLRMRVIMNPTGTVAQWKNIKWAREQAMATICRPDVAPLVITAMARFHFELGERSGRKTLQHELRKTLGISADEYDEGECAHTRDR